MWSSPKNGRLFEKAHAEYLQDLVKSGIETESLFMIATRRYVVIAIRTWVFTAFSLWSRKALLRRRGSIHLKNDYIRHRAL